MYDFISTNQSGELIDSGLYCLTPNTRYVVLRKTDVTGYPEAEDARDSILVWLGIERYIMRQSGTDGAQKTVPTLAVRKTGDFLNDLGLTQNAGKGHFNIGLGHKRLYLEYVTETDPSNPIVICSDISREEVQYWFTTIRLFVLMVNATGDNVVYLNGEQANPFGTPSQTAIRSFGSGAAESYYVPGNFISPIGVIDVNYPVMGAYVTSTPVDLGALITSLLDNETFLGALAAIVATEAGGIVDEAISSAVAELSARANDLYTSV